LGQLALESIAIREPLAGFDIVAFDVAALDDLRSAGLSPADAVVLCDHDTPDRDAMLALLLDGEAGYVAMMGSKPRAAATYAELSGRYDDGKASPSPRSGWSEHRRKGARRDRMSVLAQIIAHDHDRPGGPMRDGSR
jgi:hypothetical protein